MVLGKGGENGSGASIGTVGLATLSQSLEFIPYLVSVLFGKGDDVVIALQHGGQ